jgi:hypothetical protein
MFLPAIQAAPYTYTCRAINTSVPTRNDAPIIQPAKEWN